MKTLPTQLSWQIIFTASNNSLWNCALQINSLIKNIKCYFISIDDTDLLLLPS
jgi:hypothetical protein